MERFGDSTMKIAVDCSHGFRPGATPNGLPLQGFDGRVIDWVQGGCAYVTVINTVHATEDVGYSGGAGFIARASPPYGGHDA